MTVSGAGNVIIAGDGLVGMAIAIHCRARNVAVTLLAPQLAGAASDASAGMLAPSVERTQGAAQVFANAAREAWIRFGHLVRKAGGKPFALNYSGIMRLAHTPEHRVALRSALAPGDRWLSAAQVREREPALRPVLGAALYTGDGFVDAPACLASVRALVRADAGVSVVHDAAIAVRAASDGLVVRTAGGTELSAPTVIVAAGAWSATIAGIPTPAPVRPVRGALLHIAGVHLNAPVFTGAARSYALPRADGVVVGATADEANFDIGPSPADDARLSAWARELFPNADSLPRLAMLVGLRPMTPDSLAVIGRDPSVPGLIYAYGHGRNGFLQAALTGEVVADLVMGRAPAFDLTPFSPARFAR